MTYAWTETRVKYTGSCHCGDVTFEIEADERIVAKDCNCSICAKSAYLHLIVPKSRFKLLKGADKLTSYSYNTGIAKHLFCVSCGIKSFYIPRSNPNGYAVNARCLEPRPREVVVEPFDGQNWEQNAHKLAHLSDEASS